MEVPVSFRNTGQDPRFARAKLYLEDDFFADIGFTDPPLDTASQYGRTWRVIVDDVEINRWTINSMKKKWTIEL